MKKKDFEINHDNSKGANLENTVKISEAIYMWIINNSGNKKI